MVLVDNVCLATPNASFSEGDLVLQSPFFRRFSSATPKKQIAGRQMLQGRQMILFRKGSGTVWMKIQILNWPRLLRKIPKRKKFQPHASSHIHTDTYLYLLSLALALLIHNKLLHTSFSLQQVS